MTKRAACCAGLLLAVVGVVCADEKVMLREELQAGDTWSVTIKFDAKGNQNAPAGDKATPLPFAAQGQFAYEEKVMPIDPEAKDLAGRTVRFYTQASLESSVRDSRTTRTLREAVRVVVNEIRGGRPFLFSPSGPLTVEEFDMLQGEAPMNTLLVGQLLSPELVAPGDAWKPADAVVAALLNLDAITTNAGEVKLVEVKDATARFEIGGKIEGQVSGATTKQALTGQIVFDRARKKIARIELTRDDDRGRGPVSHALKAQSSLTIERSFDAVAHVNSEAVANLPLAANAATEQLVYTQTDGQYRFHFPRGWAVLLNNPRVTLMRLLHNGDSIAQCNILAAPTVVAGSHMDPAEFRKQVQQALGQQFQKFIQEGEVPAAKGHWVYRLAAVGQSGDLPIVWYYYIAASPQGQQLVFIFQLDARRVDQFGPQDLAVIGSLEFESAKTATNRKE
jgi:hypothetical protein